MQDDFLFFFLVRNVASRREYPRTLSPPYLPTSCIGDQALHLPHVGEYEQAVILAHARPTTCGPGVRSHSRTSLQPSYLPRPCQHSPVLLDGSPKHKHAKIACIKNIITIINKIIICIQHDKKKHSRGRGRPLSSLSSLTSYTAPFPLSVYCPCPWKCLPPWSSEFPFLFLKPTSQKDFSLCWSQIILLKTPMAVQNPAIFS